MKALKHRYYPYFIVGRTETQRDWAVLNRTSCVISDKQGSRSRFLQTFTQANLWPHIHIFLAVLSFVPAPSPQFPHSIVSSADRKKGIMNLQMWFLHRVRSKSICPMGFHTGYWGPLTSTSQSALEIPKWINGTWVASTVFLQTTSTATTHKVHTGKEINSNCFWRYPNHNRKIEVILKLQRAPRYI